MKIPSNCLSTLCHSFPVVSTTTDYSVHYLCQFWCYYEESHCRQSLKPLTEVASVSLVISQLLQTTHDAAFKMLALVINRKFSMLNILHVIRNTVSCIHLFVTGRTQALLYVKLLEIKKSKIKKKSANLCPIFGLHQ